jgi:hypothetical protein
MAAISGPLQPAKFDKYIGTNPEWDCLELELIENAVLYSPTAGNALKTYPKGTKFKLKSRNTKKIKKFMALNVGKLDGQNGWFKITSVKKPGSTDVMKAEKVAIEKLDKLLKSYITDPGPVTICTKQGRFDNCVGVKNVKQRVNGREAKADFAIVDAEDNELIFISHKKTGGGSSFQQYGGVSEKAGSASNKNYIKNHEETQTFLRETAAKIADDKLQVPTYAVVKDNDLIGKSIFGPDYPNRKYGIDNVHMIGQGDPILKPMSKDDKCFELHWSDKCTYNGAPPPTGNYQAAFCATYRSGRGFEIDGNRYDGARVGIYPIAFVKNRTNATDVG